MTYSDTSGHNASASAVIEEVRTALERAGVNAGMSANPRSLQWDDPDDRRLVREKFGDTSEEAILPGFGPDGHAENARDDCGEAHPFVCDSCGHSVDIGRTCAQSVCARCGAVWCRDYSTNKTAKTRRIRKVKHQNTPSNEHQKIHHQIVSPPLGWFYDLAKAGYSLTEAQEVTKEVVKAILDEMRAQGILIRHSYRGRSDDGSIKSESDDRGAWKERLYSRREWFGDVRSELAWKPHYHAIVVADWLKGGEFSEKIEEETGWVLHRIAGDDGVSIPNDGAMASVLTYALSHCDIQVRDGTHNRSAVWEVGSFEGDPIKSSQRFSARPSDLSWAGGRVREASRRVLGLRSATTVCGADLPAVDDPDELARSILHELYPEDQPDVEADVVLQHVTEGNISVDVTTTDGGGGTITVRDAFGEPVGPDGWGSQLPPAPSSASCEPEPAAATIVGDADQDDCGCGDDHGDADRCDGQLVPLGEARQRGLLEDEEWCREAPHVEEAREADREWPDDLRPWRTQSPGKAIGG